MGNIKKVLAMKDIASRQISSTTVWADLCENIHLHIRNIRFDFSELEWAHFRAAINSLGIIVEKIAVEKKYKEGDPNYLIQARYDVPINANTTYYPDRVLIELNRDNTVHFHYRDLRLHFALEEFDKIADLFIEAKDKFSKLKEFPYKEAVQAWIDIGLIQPYDAGHRALSTDQEHKDGIEYVKGLIQEGKHIRPILVNTEGQRLDGFKRYMAAKELGHKEIECIIDPFGVMGGQHNQNLLADKE